MRFLIDNSLSPRFAAALVALGHDAIHVRALNTAEADDETIFDLAAREHRIVVAEDTDFGMILALRTAAEPSVVLFRANLKSTERLIEMLTLHLPLIEDDLALGAVVVFEDSRYRIRRLPIIGGT